MVRRAAPIVGSSRTSEHNQVFLKSLRATLTLDPAFRGGEYSPDARPTAGMRAFARIYAGWGLSQAFYWEREYRTMGYSSLEDFLVGFWEGFWLDEDRDPNNLLAMLWTWEHGDVGRTPGFDGDTEAALRSIRCPVVAMPARTDLYFPPEDEQWASQFIEQGEVRVIDTIWGHFAGLGMNAADNAFVDRTLRELLDRPACPLPCPVRTRGPVGGGELAAELTQVLPRGPAADSMRGTERVRNRCLGRLTVGVERHPGAGLPADGSPRLPGAPESA